MLVFFITRTEGFWKTIRVLDVDPRMDDEASPMP